MLTIKVACVVGLASALVGAPSTVQKKKRRVCWRGARSTTDPEVGLKSSGGLFAERYHDAEARKSALLGRWVGPEKEQDIMMSADDVLVLEAVETTVLPLPAEDKRLLDELYVEDEKTNLGSGNNNKRGPGRSDFELNLGRAIDVLRSDLPSFSERDLDYSIYTANVEVRDPSGVALRGLDKYKQVFAAIRFFRKVMIDNVEITYRLRYDWGQRRIVVNWYSRWFARGSRRAGHVDGVSYFYLNDEGYIFRHEIDRVMVNQSPMQPPYGLSAWLKNPAAINAGLAMPEGAYSEAAYFDKQQHRLQGPGAFFMSTDNDEAATAASSSTDKKERKQPKAAVALKKQNPVARALNSAFNTCENIWDCESPMNCCDFVAFKMCCDGGVGIPAFMPQPKLIPIPIPVENYPRPPDSRY